MKTKLAIFGCLAIAGAGIWYLFLKDNAKQSWEEEGHEPVGPIKGHDEIENPEHPKSHLREVMHAAKELSS